MEDKIFKYYIKKIIIKFLSFFILINIIVANPIKISASITIDDVKSIGNFNLETYRADHYLESGTPANNAIKSIQTLEYPSQSLVNALESGDKSFIKKVNAWKVAHFATSPSEIIDGEMDEKGYYEAIILSLFVSQKDNNNFFNDQISKTNSEVNTILNNVSKLIKESDAIDASKISKNQILSTLSMEEYNALQEYCGKEFLENHPFLDNGAFVTGTVKTVFSTSETIAEAVERLCTYTQLCELSESQKAILQKLYDSCPSSNINLKSALLEVVASMDSYSSAIEAALLNAEEKQMGNLIGGLVNEGWEAVISVNPYSKAFLSGANFGTFIGDTVCSSLFSTNKIIEQYFKMKCLGEVNNVIQSVLPDLKSEYLNNKSSQNAENYFDAINIIFAIASLSCDFATNYGHIIYDDALIGKLINKPDDINKYYETITHIKDNYDKIYDTLETSYLAELEGDYPEVYEILMGIEKEINVERGIVLALDVSGSMSGNPLDETKKAASKFIETTLDENVGIGVVKYDDLAETISDFSINKNILEDVVSEINSGGGTNIEAGLSEAYEMLKSFNVEKKIIVLMSDGEPNEGKEGEDLVAYADEIKKSGVIIYTLGFFESMDSNKSSAQRLMEKIASEGCHYEVASADDLVFFFGDVADQISGQKFIYVKIACPVNVSVSYNGETLNSVDDNLNTRTSFGSLSFEENDETGNDQIKVLRLKEGFDYNIQIVGYGHGLMDYTIGFMDENGDYNDFRKFEDIKITKNTIIDTVAAVLDETILRVDKDGDGKYDITYKAGQNQCGTEIIQNIPFYIFIGSIFCTMAVLILICIFIHKIRKGKKRKAGN